MLLAGAALLCAPSRGRLLLLAGGLALGWAIGTKYPFVVPAAVLAAGTAGCAASGTRRRTLLVLSASIVLTGAYWYARDLVTVSNPLGLDVRVGPLHLAGPVSTIAPTQRRCSRRSVIRRCGARALCPASSMPSVPPGR